MVTIKRFTRNFNLDPTKETKIKPKFYAFWRKCEICKKSMPDIKLRQMFYDGWFNEYDVYFHENCLKAVKNVSKLFKEFWGDEYD